MLKNIVYKKIYECDFCGKEFSVDSNTDGDSREKCRFIMEASAPDGKVAKYATSEGHLCDECLDIFQNWMKFCVARHAERKDIKAGEQDLPSEPPKKKPGRPPKRKGTCSTCGMAMKAMSGYTCKIDVTSKRDDDTCSLYEEGKPID